MVFKGQEKRCILIKDLKLDSDETCLMYDGSSLNSFGAATENALFPLSFSLVLGTLRSIWSAHLRDVSVDNNLLSSKYASIPGVEATCSSPPVNTVWRLQLITWPQSPLFTSSFSLYRNSSFSSNSCLSLGEVALAKSAASSACAIKKLKLYMPLNPLICDL